MKLLISVTKGRNIDEFDNAVINYLHDYDQYWVCYYTQHEARHIIKEYFEAHEEYTHLVILPDDLVVNQQAIDMLLSNLSEKDYAVLVGCCNVDTAANRDKLNVSLYPINPHRVENSTYKYEFITIFDTHLFARPQPSRVFYQGDAFLILRRDIVKQLTFDTDYKLNEIEPEQGCCNDVVMSYELNQLQIPIYCNLKAVFKHLKISDAEPMSKILVGEEIAYRRFVKAS